MKGKSCHVCGVPSEWADSIKEVEIQAGLKRVVCADCALGIRDLYENGEWDGEFV